MAYNQYDEGIASRSAQFRGGSVGGNIANGALPGNSNTAAGGDQVIATSSNIDGVSEFSNERSTNNIPDDPKAYVSSDGSEVLGRLSMSGTGFVNELLVQATTTPGLRIVTLGRTPETFSSATSENGLVTYPLSGTVANASGAGYAIISNTIVWNKGTYANYTTPQASGWVPSGSANFYANYTYGAAIVTNENIPASTPIGIQQARLGNAGQTLGASSSFGGPDITR
jgi:hypothetical protein